MTVQLKWGLHIWGPLWLVRRNEPHLALWDAVMRPFLTTPSLSGTEDTTEISISLAFLQTPTILEEESRQGLWQICLGHLLCLFSFTNLSEH